MSFVNDLCLSVFLTAEWPDNENKALSQHKVSWLDPRTGTHSSTQVGRVNQGISESLWDWISVWRLGSDGTQISYFHRQAHFSPPADWDDLWLHPVYFLMSGLGVVVNIVLQSRFWQSIFSDTLACKYVFLQLSRPLHIANEFTRGKPILHGHYIQ